MKIKKKLIQGFNSCIVLPALVGLFLLNSNDLFEKRDISIKELTNSFIVQQTVGGDEMLATSDDDIWPSSKS